MMHTGSRAFCFLMALAAGGSGTAPLADAKVVSYGVQTKTASTPASAIDQPCDSGKVSTLADDQSSQAIVSSGSTAVGTPAADAAEDLLLLAVAPLVPLENVAAVERDPAPEVVPTFPGEQLHDVEFSNLSDTVCAQQSVAVGLSYTGSAQPLLTDRRYSFFDLPLRGPSLSATYDTDGRRLTSLAHARKRQLLFVKISRG